MTNETLTIAGYEWEFRSSRIRNVDPKDTNGVEELSKRLGQDYGGHQRGWVMARYGRHQQHDPLGFFTKESGLVVAGPPGNPTGMIAWTDKRGGSLKITALAGSDESSAARLTREMIALAQNNPNVRKVYGTVNRSNRQVLRMADHLGFVPEATLPDQYKEGSDEIVLGKVLRPAEQISASYPMAISSEDTVKKVRQFDSSQDMNELKRLFEYLSGWHNDVGADFLKQTIQGASYGALDIMRKGKSIFVAERTDDLNGVLILDPKSDLSGAVVLTGKMGGPLKMYPLLGNRESQLELVKTAQKLAAENDFRIVYTFSPASDSNEAELLESFGLTPRGRLKEPYKPGVDLIPWSARVEELRV